MAAYLKTGFIGANATLSNVFDSVTEDDANTTFRFDATGGLFSLEGAAVTWAGSPPTADAAYGTVLLNASRGQPFILQSKRNRPTHLRIAFQIAWPSIAGFTTNDRIKVVQVMCNNASGTEIELCSVSFQKTASSYRWRIDSFDGSNTLGDIFAPTGFSYATHQGWCIDIIMKPDVAHVYIGTVWGWTNSYAMRHQFTTTNVFAPESASHIPTKVNIGSVSATTTPTAASEMNLDDIFIVDNAMENPGFYKPFGEHALGLVGTRNVDLLCHTECDFAQTGLPYQSYVVFGAPPSGNITLGDVDPSTQISIDEGAVYMVSTISVESIVPNSDNPTSRADPNAGKGAMLGRGYTQLYTEKYNSESTSLPSVPYWEMASPIRPVNYILVPPGHNQIVIYNGQFVEMEVYIHRVRFPY